MKYLLIAILLLLTSTASAQSLTAQCQDHQTLPFVSDGEGGLKPGAHTRSAFGHIQLVMRVSPASVRAELLLANVVYPLQRTSGAQVYFDPQGGVIYQLIPAYEMLIIYRPMDRVLRGRVATIEVYRCTITVSAS